MSPGTCLIHAGRTSISEDMFRMEYKQAGRETPSRTVGQSRYLERVFCALMYRCAELRMKMSPGGSSSVCVCLILLTEFRIGVDLFHPRIIKIRIDDLFPAAPGRRTSRSLVIADQGDGRDYHIGGHEHDQDPGGDVSGHFGDLFDPL